MDFPQLEENQTHIFQVAASGMLALLILLGKPLLRKAANVLHKKHDYSQQRIKSMESIISTVLNTLLVLGLITIWGIPLKSLWVIVSSVLGLIAVAFFAVWSMLSNIVAYILIFITNPIRLGAYVILKHPVELEGEVVEIGLFHTVIQTPEKGMLFLTNTTFFQNFFIVLDAAPPVKKESAGDKNNLLP